jgi:benzodiazapine receptor
MKFFENKIVQIVIACLIPLIGGWINGYMLAGEIKTWSSQLIKPDWNPPDWIFGPVWSILYIFMGYASFRVYDEGDGFKGRARWPLIMYIIQLLVNQTWSAVYFYYHLIGVATIQILVLFVLLSITGVLFYRIDKTAGILYIPYFSWIAFASCLCFRIWQLNS